MIPKQTPHYNKPSNRTIFLAAVFFVISIIATYSLFRNYPENGIVEGLALKSVPPPTEIDSNFLYQVNTCFIPTAAAYGYDLRITSGFRSLDEQAALYAQGRTVEGHIVTYTLKSIHNFGFAVDVVDRARGYDINWDRIGEMGRYCGLEQGDDEYDEQVHFQHRQGISTAQFESGMRPDQLSLPCQLMADRASKDEPLTRSDLSTCGAPIF